MILKYLSFIGVLIAIVTIRTQAQNTFPANGYVGIGTTSPQSLLDINGNTRITPVSASWAEGLQFYMPNTTRWGGLRWSRNRANYDGNFYIGYTALDATDDLVFGANSGGTQIDNILRLTKSGNVGIGTTSPGAKLEVSGNLKLTAGSGASVTYQDGSVQTVAWNGVLSGGDYAESVDVVGERAQYEPGDVLVIDPTLKGRLMKSTEAYSTAVMGIYSTRPGVVGRRQKTDKSHMSDEVPMAMVGVVPTKVSAESGAIRPGDLLVTSSKPGYAMRGTDRSLLTGAIIGKALEPLDAGIGVIEVAVSIQ